MYKRVLLVVLVLLLVACRPDEPEAKPEVVTMADQAGDIAAVPVARGATTQTDYLRTTYWPAATLDAGTASISCEYDYLRAGDGTPLASLEFFSVVDALTQCQPQGVVRVRYEGKIGAGFTALVQRVAAIADRMEIRTRILDLDSTGGHVEEALRAGDSIAESHWAIWIREGSLCHSACVMILAAGDTRSIAGKVGIHRLFRDRSTATTRAELNEELREINTQVRDYMARNGVAATVADLMMTVPSRRLRLLTEDELKEYGLDGTNAAQEDLDRIRVMRKCGEEFVRRKDAWTREFDAQCMEPGKAFEDMAACGRALDQQHGFPDAKCPSESPSTERAQPLGPVGMPVARGGLVEAMRADSPAKDEQ
ncbi:MAG TPA: hypothetical protein VGD42_07075 [Lysobacter sp.]